MISLIDATIEYPKKRLELPTIMLSRGETLGLSGESGSGKSSVAMVLAGFIKQKSGTISIPHCNKNSPNPVQWVGQHPELAFNPKWTIRRSLQESFQNHDFTDLLKRFDIDEQWLDRLPKALSGGQLQRLALLRALTPYTQYLLCDEITAQLDSITQQIIWAQLRLLQKERKLGILLISHDTYLLSAMCKNIVRMS